MPVLSSTLGPVSTSLIKDRSFGILSTYPPTACGLATFSAALRRGLLHNGAAVGVIRIADETMPHHDDGVVAELENGNPTSVANAATVLNRFDVSIIQHEYGVYGGTDGDEVIDIVRSLTGPSIVVAHTVLESPSPHQRWVLEQVVDAASAVVVMSEAALGRLRANFDVDMTKAVMIPHGATVIAAASPTTHALATEGATLLTWGLLGPGKGIEWAIDALAQLGDIDPSPRLIVAGRTHPKVAAQHGEAYREMLKARAVRAGVGSQVVFDDAYRDLGSLMELVASATAVVLPYDSPDQATSGVLVDAIAAGRPVVATAFPHACEALATGAGLVVPRRDPDALAAALRRVLTEPGLLASMAAEAARIAPTLSWPAIAARYNELASESLSQPPALSV